MVAKPRRNLKTWSWQQHKLSEDKRRALVWQKKCSYVSGPLSPHYSLLALAAAKACSIELWAGDCFLILVRSTKPQLCYLGSEPLALGKGLAEASGDSRQKPILSVGRLGQSTSIVISDALRANCLLGEWENLDLVNHSNLSIGF